MALELRPSCEMCDRDLPPHAMAARICTYECTFCAACAEGPLRNVCPNCGGGFAPRPIRPATAWRPGLSTAHQPPSDRRRAMTHPPEEVAAHVARLAGIAPERR